MLTSNPFPNRHSIRLPGFDYAKCGATFATINTHGRQHLFGEVVDGNMPLNRRGFIVMEEWTNTPTLRGNIQLGEWVIMPNHFHGIVLITDCLPTHPNGAPINGFGQPVPGALSTVIRSFKSIVTRRINETSNSPDQKIWHRNFWERIIRDEEELSRISAYTRAKPKRSEEPSSSGAFQQGEPDGGGRPRIPAQGAVASAGGETPVPMRSDPPRSSDQVKLVLSKVPSSPT